MARQNVTTSVEVVGVGLPYQTNIDRINANFTELYAPASNVVIAAATDAPTTMAQLNVLIAQLKTKGVIAT